MHLEYNFGHEQWFVMYDIMQSHQYHNYINMLNCIHKIVPGNKAHLFLSFFNSKHDSNNSWPVNKKQNNSREQPGIRSEGK